MIPSLLSVAGIHVDTSISPIELMEFYKLVDSREKHLDTLSSWIESVIESIDGSIPLPTVYSYFSQNPRIIGTILNVRRKVVSYALGKERVHLITYRYKHINSIKEYQMKHNQRLPPEGCKSRIKRIFNRNTNPYLYNFEPSQYMTIESLTALFRMSYGYKPPTAFKPIFFKQGAICPKNLRKDNNRNRIIRISTQPGGMQRAKSMKMIKMKSMHLSAAKSNGNPDNEDEDDLFEPEFFWEIAKLPSLHGKKGHKIQPVS